MKSLPLNRLLISLSTIFFSFNYSLSQIPTEQDCLGAIPICDFIYTTPSSTFGAGNYLDEDGPLTCLIPGEQNSQWFIFTVVQSGDLAFTTIPLTTGADYDWSLYNITNATCEDILTDASLEVSCNSSQWGVTGISSTGTGNWNGAGYTFAFNYLLPVIAGETYVLNMNNWSFSTGGYTLDFSASTAVIFDTVPPKLDTVQAVACNTTEFSFSFSEKVLCNTVEDADFILEGPGGPYTLSDVIGIACADSGDQENNFTITVSPPLTIGGTYTFILTGASDYVTDLCGNVADSFAITVTVNAVIASIDSVIQPICDLGGGVIFASGNSGTPPYTYSLNSGPFQSSGSFTGLSAGNYVITVIDSIGCTDTTSVTLVPGAGGVTASILSSTQLNCFDDCTGVIVAGAAGGAPPYSYLWTNNGGTNATASNLCSGAYQVTITDDEGCFDTTSITLNAPDTTIVSIIQLLQPTCNGYADGSITVEVSGGTPGYSYSWSPSGGTGLTASDLSGGVYTLTVTDANECIYDTAIFLPQPSPVIIDQPDDTSICIGSEAVLFAFVSGGTSPYNIEWNGSTPGNPFTTSPSSDTAYFAIATDVNGCFSEPVNFNVLVIQIPVVDLGRDTLLCLGDTLQLNANFPGAQYLWQDGTTDDQLVINQQGIYWVDVYNSCFSESDTLVADITNCESCIHYPTAFSPNADQNNSIFHPLITCPVTSYLFRIYNRWGELIFETNDVNGGWNGIYKNTAVGVGTYVWYAEYTGLRHSTPFSEMLTGNVTVVR